MDTGLKKRNLITTGYHLPYNPSLKQKARDLRKNMTPAEKKLWHSCLKNFPYTVLRQKPLDHFIADFYCAKLKLVIEIDGPYHYTEEGLAYDLNRTEVLSSYGLNLLRFRNEEVMNYLEEVIKRIENYKNEFKLQSEANIKTTSIK